jgi:phospholipid/cholesterol/gamma-HCH transport system ATP-binding protein
MCPIIELSHVYTRIGASVVHEDINLQVTRGEIFALVGGSGAGKSVLLREIIMLQAPTSGSIRVLGQEVVGIDERGALELRRRFGVLFQKPALFDGLTVAENVAIPFREHTSLNRTLIMKLAALKLAFAGFPAEGVHRYPSELSPSMRKRAALARAIALDPELLFLDEPSTGLDPYSARELDDLIQQLKESLGLTVFIVTHDLDSLWRATDRVAVLGDRSIRGVGTMEELTQSEDPLIRVYFYGPRGQSAWQRARDRDASA